MGKNGMEWPLGANRSELAAHFANERQLLEIRSANRAQPTWQV